MEIREAMGADPADAVPRGVEAMVLADQAEEQGQWGLCTWLRLMARTTPFYPRAAHVVCLANSLNGQVAGDARGNLLTVMIGEHAWALTEAGWASVKRPKTGWSPEWWTGWTACTPPPEVIAAVSVAGGQAAERWLTAHNGSD